MRSFWYLFLLTSLLHDSSRLMAQSLERPELSSVTKEDLLIGQADLTESGGSTSLKVSLIYAPTTARLTIRIASAGDFVVRHLIPFPNKAARIFDAEQENETVRLLDDPQHQAGGSAGVPASNWVLSFRKKVFVGDVSYVNALPTNAAIEQEYRFHVTFRRRQTTVPSALDPYQVIVSKSSPVDDGDTHSYNLVIRTADEAKTALAKILANPLVEVAEFRNPYAPKPRIGGTN